MVGTLRAMVGTLRGRAIFGSTDGVVVARGHAVEWSGDATRGRESLPAATAKGLRAGVGRVAG